jgi:hypothetical protein
MIPHRQTKKLTKPVPIPTAAKQTPKAVPSRNFFTPLRVNDMDTATTAAENTLPEKEAHRKSGRPPPLVITSATNLIQLQSDLKKTQQRRVQVPKYMKWNPYMAHYSAMKSCLETHNLHYFTLSQNREKPIKAVICHLSPDKPAEDISDSLVDSGFNVISLWQMTATQRPPNWQTNMKLLCLYLHTITRNIKWQEIFSVNHIIIKIELYRDQIGFAKTLALSRPTATNPLDVWCGGGHLHRKCPEKMNTEFMPSCCNFPY